MHLIEADGLYDIVVSYVVPCSLHKVPERFASNRTCLLDSPFKSDKSTACVGGIVIKKGREMCQYSYCRLSQSANLGEGFNGGRRTRDTIKGAYVAKRNKKIAAKRTMVSA